MAEQLTNAMRSPSATLVTASITAGTTTAFDLTWLEPSPPTTGTYSLIFRGAADDGSDDSIFRVSTMADADSIATGSWEKVGAQSTFVAGCEIDLDLSKAGVNQVVSDHDGGTTAHASATNLVHISGAETLTGAKTGPNGSASAATWAARAAGNGFYSSAASTLDLTSGGTQAVSITTALVSVQTTRELRPLGGLLLQNKVRTGIYRPVRDDLVGDGAPTLAANITNAQTSFTVDDTSLWEPGAQALTSGQFSICVSDGVNLEWMVVTSFTAGAPGTLNVRRDLTGSGAFAFAAGANVNECAIPAGGNVYDNVVLPTDGPILTSLSGAPLTGNITVWTPPRGTLGSWVKPAQDGRLFYVSIRDMNGYTATFKDPDSRSTILTLSNTAGLPAGVDFYFDSVNGAYAPMGSYKEV